MRFGSFPGTAGCELGVEGGRCGRVSNMYADGCVFYPLSQMAMVR